MTNGNKRQSYIVPEDQEITDFSTDFKKRYSYKDTICNDLDTSIKRDIIRENNYTIEKKQLIDNTKQETQNSVFKHHKGRYLPNSADIVTQKKLEKKEEVLIKEEKNFQNEHKQLNFTGSRKHNHINNVEKDIRETLFGSIEHESNATKLSNGTIVADTSKVFKTENRDIFASSISNTISDSIKHDLKSSEVYADKIWRKEASNKGILQTFSDIADREITAANHGIYGNIDDRAREQAQKFGYKAGKYSLLGVKKSFLGSFRIAKYGKKLSNDITTGVISYSDAKKLLSNRVKESLIGSSVSATRLIGDGTSHIIEDFQGSDDLGMQAITKPKNAIIKTARTFKFAKATGKKINNGFKIAKKASKRIEKIRNAIFSAGKKILSNPVMLKGIGIAISVIVIIAVIISIISSITGVLPTFSLKSEEYELSQTYLYITELDARMEEDIIHEDTRLSIPPIDEYRYYINGMEATKENMKVYTNADSILTYLDSRYDDYTFDGIIGGIFGTNIKDEVKAIHQQLHKVEKVRWTEEIEHQSTSTDPVTKETSTETWTEYIYHMDIYLTTQSWESYYEENKDALLTADQQEQYSSLKEVGVYTFRQEIASPFEEENWQMGISSRWGWYVHQSGELKQHLGIDITIDRGTPIKACNSGKVETGYSSSLGNYVKVVKDNGDYTLYGHMSNITVISGNQVESGDIIGNVGSTGESTSNHLYLEYNKNGKNLNPLIFLGISSSSAGLSDGSLSALITEAEKYIGFPYVWGGSNPSTSFDCSGFICWIFTQSGTYNLPRTTAQGIYNQCMPISPNEAQPGDLIFFTKTYKTSSPVTHIGLYTGNNRMIHCGNPIGYTSISTSYWKNHFYGYGRLR